LASRFNSPFMSWQLIALLGMVTGLPAEEKNHERT
jgi:hypothetical protein